jgi:hypothetical protein
MGIGIHPRLAAVDRRQIACLRLVRVMGIFCANPLRWPELMRARSAGMD